MRTYKKAIAGFIGTTIAGLGNAMLDGNITQTEAFVALGAGLVLGGGLVYAAPRNEYRP